VAFGLTGCPGSLGFDADGGSTGVGGSTGGQQTSCATSGTVLQMCTLSCHNAVSKAAYANLDLMSDGVAQRLVGQPAATANNGLCGGKGNLLNRGTLPATGILIDKISGHQTCGGAMPFGSDNGLVGADLDCLQAWANGLVQGVGP